jgi:hypothetical protein
MGFERTPQVKIGNDLEAHNMTRQVKCAGGLCSACGSSHHFPNLAAFSPPLRRTALCLSSHHGELNCAVSRFVRDSFREIPGQSRTLGLCHHWNGAWILAEASMNIPAHGVKK